MDKKMDGVKISVNETDDSQVERPLRKKAAVRKKAVRRKAVKKVVAPEKREMIEKKLQKEKKDSKGGVLTMAISVFVTALIVGGAIYAWQSKVADKDVEKVSSDARSSRQEFEKRLDNLKEKLLGTEKEKEELLKNKEELEEKAKLLENAKKNYINDEMGFSFLYPAIFGEVEIEIIASATGTKFIGKFSKNDKLIFGGTSADYVRASTSTVMDFIDTYGFADKKNKYYYQPGGMDENTDFEIQPAKIVGYRGGEALLLNKKSFSGQDEFSKNSGESFIDIGENLGGLFNLKNKEYKGVAFVNMDFGLMNVEEFAEMLKSIEVN
ncbi:hypothetical protein KAJ61_03895 [Candidatus Parcubacteria bacterium]|nr:hypothetical protein [Candidatus Parcubacteria bacterium]